MIEILSKVIEYCRKHVEAQKTSDEKAAEDSLKSWDAEFVNVDHDTLFGLIVIRDDVIKPTGLEKKLVSVRIGTSCGYNCEALFEQLLGTLIDSFLCDAMFYARARADDFAANYLDIKSLLDLTCQTIVDMIKGKTPEEIRNIFQ
ncbi:hypothetical protein ACLOJK_025735 [Asimina triloba]